MELNELIEREKLAVELAKKASMLMKETSGSLKTIAQKESHADLVTETDRNVEKLLFDELRKHYPSDRFIGEEESSKSELTDEPTWIIDPVDGTTNFVHTFPFCCISIGFAVKKEPCIGVIYNPFLDHLYTAIKGQGAKLVKGDGGEPQELRVRSCNSLRESLVMTEYGGSRDEKKRDAILKALQVIQPNCHGVRSMGSAALNICSIASGYVDIYYEFGIHIWDICAAIVVLQEAKGYVCDTQGGPVDLCARRLIAASSENLAKELSSLLPVHLELERD